MLLAVIQAIPALRASPAVIQEYVRAMNVRTRSARPAVFRVVG